MKCLPGAALIMYVSVALSACGQKGPLVLPDAAKRKHTLVPASAAPNDNGGTAAPADPSAPSPAPPGNPAPSASPAAEPSQSPPPL